MPEGSYTTSLFKKGVNKMAQKVGEEAVETIIEATNGNNEKLIYESSDLLYHLIVLLTSKGLRIEDVVKELQMRHDPAIIFCRIWFLKTRKERRATCPKD